MELAGAAKGSKNKNRKIGLAILALVMIWLVAGIIGCQKQEKTEVIKQEKMTYPDQEAWNSNVNYTTNGILTARINYGHMQRFKNRKVAEFDEGIIIDFYNEKGEHTSRLTSDRGKLNEATSSIEAFDNVVVVSDSGIDLKTEHLWWDNTIEKVMSDEFVTITTLDNDTLYGYGFESDQYLNNWEIKVHSAKAGRSLELDLGISKKKEKADSTKVDTTRVDSTINLPDTVQQKYSNRPK